MIDEVKSDESKFISLTMERECHILRAIARKRIAVTYVVDAAIVFYSAKVLDPDVAPDDLDELSVHEDLYAAAKQHIDKKRSADLAGRPEYMG